MDIKLFKLKIKLLMMYKGIIISKTINPENAQQFLDALEYRNPISLHSCPACITSASFSEGTKNDALYKK